MHIGCQIQRRPVVCMLAAWGGTDSPSLN